MKNKILAGILILLTGIFLGGISYYFLGEITGRHKGYVYINEPRVPRQIIETSRAFSEIASSISPAVVNISTTKVMRRQGSLLEDPFFDFFNPFRDFRMPRKWKEQSLGSGVIVSPEGYIITNNHVVEQADEIKVTLFDKRSFRAQIIGSDPKTDIAVVKINAKNLHAVQWGDSDRLQVGEFVLSIGNPYGLSHTVTMGIISAVGRANVGIADYEDFIQTDAAINPGNSGGPLVNTQGKLIGINTAIFSRTGGYQGIGFAVPSNMARLVMDQLVEQGKVTRGWMGVTIQEITPDLAKQFGLKASTGALVGEVFKDGPAEKAGIRRGDIILSVDGKTVKDVAHLRNMVSQSKAGKEIPVVILRDGREYSMKVVIAEQPREIAGASPGVLPGESSLEELAGLDVTDLTRDIARQLDLPKEEKGVVVVRVEPGGSASEAGIRKGDVIQEIDRKKIENLKDYNKVISGIGAGDTVLLYINRGGKKFYLTIKAS